MNADGGALTVYIPIPVEAVAELGRRYGKNIVVVNGWDATHGVLHTTTWGDAPIEKHHAAIAGELTARSLRADLDDVTRFEDYRLRIAQQLYTALWWMVEWHGGEHESDRPEDDTCNCRFKAANDHINAALRDAEVTLGFTKPALDWDGAM